MSGNLKPNWNAVSDSPQLTLEDGDRVGVIGGGPAGSFFSYFFLEMVQRAGLDITLDIYEPKDFFQPSPKGCNMCGGIISETLVQMLAAEGINLPPQIVQRGIESYTLHTDRGIVSIETPLHEKRIAAVHRGSGPKGTIDSKWGSFDGYLQILAIEKGANLYQSKVEKVLFDNGHPKIITKDIEPVQYDLLAVAAGVNSRILQIFPELDKGYKLPGTTKTVIREYYLGEEVISEYFGNSMHIFLLDLPNVDFAAFIPKGEYVTFCMLGKDISAEVLATFMNSPEVRNTLPETIYKDHISCHCNPKINIKQAIQPFADRMVFIGDCGVTRLYKDGIGGAYRTAKIAASTAVFQGISSLDFKKHFWPVCKHLNYDNNIGKLIFAVTKINQKVGIARQAMLNMVQTEQVKDLSNKFMSTVLWDMFTGSASYREVLILTLHPGFLFRYLASFVRAIFGRKQKQME